MFILMKQQLSSKIRRKKILKIVKRSGTWEYLASEHCSNNILNIVLESCNEQISKPIKL